MFQLSRLDFFIPRKLILESSFKKTLCVFLKILLLALLFITRLMLSVNGLKLKHVKLL